MNRRELVKTLADKMSVTQAEAMRFVQAWEQTERIGRNPRNGVAYMIRARRSVKFKPGKLLLKRLNASSSK